MTDSMVESDIRSMRADIASLAEMQEVQNSSIDNAVNLSMFTRNRMSKVVDVVEDHDMVLKELCDQLHHWQTLVIVMAGWMAVITVLWAIGVI